MAGTPRCLLPWQPIGWCLDAGAVCMLGLLLYPCPFRCMVSHSATCFPACASKCCCAGETVWWSLDRPAFVEPTHPHWGSRLVLGPPSGSCYGTGQGFGSLLVVSWFYCRMLCLCWLCGGSLLVLCCFYVTFLLSCPSVVFIHSMDILPTVRNVYSNYLDIHRTSVFSSHSVYSAGRSLVLPFPGGSPLPTPGSRLGLQMLCLDHVVLGVLGTIAAGL
eukprot:gene24344-biopygen2905